MTRKDISKKEITRLLEDIVDDRLEKMVHSKLRVEADEKSVEISEFEAIEKDGRLTQDKLINRLMMDTRGVKTRPNPTIGVEREAEFREFYERLGLRKSEAYTLAIGVFMDKYGKFRNL
jgi:hypothetical protein